MERKPDVIRALVFVFALGLAVTGFTTLQASESDQTVSADQSSTLTSMLD